MQIMSRNFQINHHTKPSPVKYFKAFSIQYSIEYVIPLATYKNNERSMINQ